MNVQEIEDLADRILEQAECDPLKLAVLRRERERRRVLTVRLPQSFHMAIIAAGFNNEISLNSFAVRQLLSGPDTLRNAARYAAEQDLAKG